MRFQNGFNNVVIERRFVQFWPEIILVISNRTRAARSFDFEITRTISDQIALHPVQLPLLTSNNQRLANAGEEFFLSIWWIKDLGAYRERSGDFVCPWAHPPGFTRFFLHFDSNNRVIVQNLWNSNTTAFHATLIPLFAFLRFSNML